MLRAVNQPVLTARGLTKIYRMGEVSVHALRGVDLDLHAGELVVILGPSGSGKSTLLNLLGGLDTPTSGTLRYSDHDLTRADARALTRYRREHVGFVFQFYNLPRSSSSPPTTCCACPPARSSAAAASGRCSW
jgi:putative ABC transport system ATP-binding protein